MILTSEQPVLLIRRISDPRRRVVTVGNDRCRGIPRREVHHVRAVLRHPRQRTHPLLARPLIDVLADVPVNGLHVVVIETTLDRCVGELIQSSGRGKFFLSAKRRGVGFVELVP